MSAEHPAVQDHVKVVKRDPLIAFKRYGNSRWATSFGRSLDIRIGRFYLFIDAGRIIDRD